jgi:signal transduction histidine kinase
MFALTQVQVGGGCRAQVPKILIADDYPGNRLAVRRALKGVDAEIHEAANGFDALSLSLENDYAVILLDVGMPDIDGFEVCGQLRTDPRTADTPVILVTGAFVDAKDAINGYAEGATDYLTKPFSDHLLRAKVQVFLRLHYQRQALREAVRAAEAARAKAERATLARSKFLATASHDLRQPVQSLMLLLEAMKPLAASGQLERIVGHMENALTGLGGLLNSLLDLSRLDAGVLVPQVKTVDLGELVERLGSEYAIAATDKDLRLRVFSRPWKVLTDASMLERAIRNLIENALRYTPRGGILLGLRRRGGAICLDVVDTGIGIPPGHEEHIFEEFYQVGNPGRDRAQGLGLGLSIVARICRLVGAKISVLSSEGHGTRFSVHLPPADDHPSAARGRILLIEDDPVLRTCLCMMMEEWGYDVAVAAAAHEALAIAADPVQPISVIVADQRLGHGPSGAETAREISRRIGRAVPTLIVTGDSEPADLSATGFEILHKPIGADDLKARLETAASAAAR